MKQITFTSINHSARKQFGLTMNAYAVIDLIYYLSSNPQSDYPNWCYASKDSIAQSLDLSRRYVTEVIELGIEKGLLEKHEATKHIKTTTLWYESTYFSKSDDSSHGEQKVLTNRAKSAHQSEQKVLTINNIDIYNNKEEKENITKEKEEKPIEIYTNKFNELFHSKYRVNDKNTAHLYERLNKYSLEEILVALENLSKSEWHQGKNDRHWKADPEFLIRNDNQIDKWLNFVVEEEEEIRIGDNPVELDEFIEQMKSLRDMGDKLLGKEEQSNGGATGTTAVVSGTPVS